MRFICDSMLGDVARWLRLLGYDTLYSRNYEDWEILRIAQKDSRVILTRDVGLFRRARRKKLDAILVEHAPIEDILAEIAFRSGIDLEFSASRTRCPHCNVKLVSISKAEALSLVKPEVAVKYDRFWLCPRCRRVYWQGNHWKTISAVLEKANRKLLELRVRKSGRGRKPGGA